MREFTYCGLEDSILLDNIIEMNKKGYFDCYSENHFLIKALNGRFDSFYNKQHLIKNSHFYGNEFANAQTFIMNFAPKFNFFASHFSEKNIRNFVVNQLSAGKKHYDEKQFFNALAEINVINHLVSLSQLPLKKAIYEPILGVNGSNPEVRLIFEGDIIVDVEVKTAGFNNIQISEKPIFMPIMLMNEEDIFSFQKKCEKMNIQYLPPRVNKLKDFINSAGKKFEPIKDAKHINLLFINWTFSDILRKGYYEPYSLLYNNYNGLLKNPNAYKEINIDLNALEKISAIIVYQENFDSLISGALSYIWKEHDFKLLPNKLIAENLINIDSLFQITNMRPPEKFERVWPYLAGFKDMNQLINAYPFNDYINQKIKYRISQSYLYDNFDNFFYFNRRSHKKMIKESRRKMRKVKEFNMFFK